VTRAWRLGIWPLSPALPVRVDRRTLSQSWQSCRGTGSPSESESDSDSESESYPGRHGDRG